MAPSPQLTSPATTPIPKAASSTGKRARVGHRLHRRPNPSIHADFSPVCDDSGNSDTKTEFSCVNPGSRATPSRPQVCGRVGFQFLEGHHVETSVDADSRPLGDLDLPLSPVSADTDKSSRPIWTILPWSKDCAVATRRQSGISARPACLRCGDLPAFE